MVSEMKIVEEPRKTLSMHPKKFGMWLFLGSVLMLFASWTSAYIVRRAEGNWLYFELPSIFRWTSLVILASSVTIQMAYRSAKRNHLSQLKNWMLATAILGLVFLAGQWMGWADLVRNSVYFIGNPSGSFVYVITGFHGLHLISAIIYVLIVLKSSFNGKIGPSNMAPIEMCATYWHFLGALWIYLFVFLTINR